MLSTLLLTLMWCIAAPDAAYAWGPGMHLALAGWCLTHVNMAAPALITLLKKYPRHFTYGAVSPDIYLSKQRAGKMFHCHHWHMGRLLLDEAKTDAQRAAVYGYLVHLAADVIAHSYFIPTQIIQHFRARWTGHAYWEIFFDLQVHPVSWTVIRDVVRGDFHDFDDLLDSVLKKTLFSFRTSQRILKTLLVVQRFGQVGPGLRVVSRRSPYALAAPRVRYFHELVEATLRAFLANPEAAEVTLGDPTGLAREADAWQIRRQLRHAVRTKSHSREAIAHYIAQCETQLRAQVFAPAMQWPIWD